MTLRRYRILRVFTLVYAFMHKGEEEEADGEKERRRR